MNNFNEIAVLLLKEGYEFSIFVKKNVDSPSRGNVKFSNAYVTTAAEELLPTGVWDLVDGGKIIKYDSKLCGSKNSCRTISLPLNHPAVVEKYVYSALKLLRQVPCKAIAKVWIKVIEPRKKTRYPYIKGNTAKPLWWPNDVEHREPDHLQKPDRLKLMCTILTQVLPQLGCVEIVDEVSRSTFALSLFKQDPQKNLIMSSMFDIPRELCISHKMKKAVVDVVDLSQFKRKCKITSTTPFGQQQPTPDHHLNLESGHTTQPTTLAMEHGSADYIMGTFENGSLSPPILIDLLVKNDPDLDDYIDRLNVCAASSSEY